MGGFVEFSATRKGPELSHHQKQLLCSSVSHRHLHHHCHTFMALLPNLFFLFVAFCVCPLQGFYLIRTLMGRARGGSSPSVVSIPPKFSASCLLSSPEHPHASPAHPRSSLWNFHWGNAEWDFFLEDLSLCLAVAAPWGSLTRESVMEDSYLCSSCTSPSLQEFPLWPLFQLECPPFICQASRTT